MSFEMDESELQEAVARGDADWIWSAYEYMRRDLRDQLVDSRAACDSLEREIQRRNQDRSEMNDIVEELADLYEPDETTVDVIKKLRASCSRCPFAFPETIMEGAMSHETAARNVVALVKELIQTGDEEKATDAVASWGAAVFQLAQKEMRERAAQVADRQDQSAWGIARDIRALPVHFGQNCTARASDGYYRSDP